MKIRAIKRGQTLQLLEPIDLPDGEIGISVYSAEAEEVLPPRCPGGWEGQVWIADDFDDESEEVNAMFYGEVE